MGRSDGAARGLDSPRLAQRSSREQHAGSGGWFDPDPCGAVSSTRSQGCPLPRQRRREAGFCGARRGRFCSLEASVPLSLARVAAPVLHAGRDLIRRGRLESRPWSKGGGHPRFHRSATLSSLCAAAVVVMVLHLWASVPRGERGSSRTSPCPRAVIRFSLLRFGLVWWFVMSDIYWWYLLSIARFCFDPPPPASSPYGRRMQVPSFEYLGLSFSS